MFSGFLVGFILNVWVCVLCVWISEAVVCTHISCCTHIPCLFFSYSKVQLCFREEHGAKMDLVQYDRVNWSALKGRRVCVCVCVCVQSSLPWRLCKDVYDNSSTINEPPFIDFNEILIASLIHSLTLMET